MGLAALFVAGLIALAIVVAILYGTILGLVRFARFLWRVLVPEAAPLGEAVAGLARQPCWKEKECPPQVRESCPAYQQKDGMPCWLANMRAEGRLRVSCLTCNRFNVAALVG